MIRQERPFPERRLRGVLDELATRCSRYVTLTQSKTGASSGRKQTGQGEAQAVPERSGECRYRCHLGAINHQGLAAGSAGNMGAASCLSYIVSDLSLFDVLSGPHQHDGTHPEGNRQQEQHEGEAQGHHQPPEQAASRSSWTTACVARRLCVDDQQQQAHSLPPHTGQGHHLLTGRGGERQRLCQSTDSLSQGEVPLLF